MGFRFRDKMDLDTDESQWAVHLDLHNEDRFGHKAYPIAASPFMFDTNEEAVAEAGKIVKALPRLKWQMVQYNKAQWWWELYDPRRKTSVHEKGQPVLVSTKGYSEESDGAAALSKVIRHIDTMHLNKHGKANAKMKATEEKRHRRQLSRWEKGKAEGWVESVVVPKESILRDIAAKRRLKGAAK